jgi:hypothetical protein
MDFNISLSLFAIGGFDLLFESLERVKPDPKLTKAWQETSVEMSPGVDSPLYWYREALIAYQYK